jgi:hypothetical protein
MIIWMLKNDRKIMNTETEKLLIKTAEAVAERQEFYDADIDIYGHFSEHYKEITQFVKST